MQDIKGDCCLVGAGVHPCWKCERGDGKRGRCAPIALCIFGTNTQRVRTGSSQRRIVRHVQRPPTERPSIRILFLTRVSGCHSYSSQSSIALLPRCTQLVPDTDAWKVLFRVATALPVRYLPKAVGSAFPSYVAAAVTTGIPRAVGHSGKCNSQRIRPPVLPETPLPARVGLYERLGKPEMPA